MVISSAVTAGRGDPYWYEWFVGVTEVIRLLDPNTEVQSVAFQVPGIKGWDDVVVRMKDGRRRCYQAKHTRVENNLTFGSLVQRNETENNTNDSLLSSLFASWKSSGLNDGLTRCILFTNREAGNQASTTHSGIHRPPLLAFIGWLNATLPQVQSIDESVPEDDWKAAWSEWLTQLQGSKEEQLAFLRAFEILTDQDDLDGLVRQISDSLARAFGVSVERISPCLDALHRALRKWTTGHAAVTVEDLFSELALVAEPRDLAPAPPPPAPFFPTRVPVAEELERDLTSSGGEPVFFLTAEPGAGKTSVLSWLANRRVATPFTGHIGLRFFCFEPIRPDTPFIAPDASRVRPSDLWFSLLVQLREGLRGRLHELGVPLRNDFLKWEEARTHVLRLASLLGKEHQQAFVIVIDGIDHAARAAQTNPEQSAAFFASLPSPDELRGKAIRLLIAGQPSELYSAHYPSWLTAPHPSVRKIELRGLEGPDVRALYATTGSTIPSSQSEEVIRLIQQLAKGNTLCTVFAVAEAMRVDSLDALSRRLEERRLSDGVAAYYSAIWRHTLHSAGELAEHVGDCLVASLSLARTGVTAEFFARVFHDWSKPAAWWEQLLESLGPLLTLGPDGYRLRHNDIRVFLAGRYATISDARRRRVTSQLARHYQQPDSDRLAAHLQLFDVLKLAGESAEFARSFTVDWVVESGALDIESNHLLDECQKAVQGLAELRNWSLVVPVACAVQTLERLIEARDHTDYATTTIAQELPPFLPAEAAVRPWSQWTIADLRSLARDTAVLLEAGDNLRALALLQRWLQGLDLGRIVEQVPGLVSEFGPRNEDGTRELDQDAASVFERLGRVCRRVGWMLPLGDSTSELYNAARYFFDKGAASVIVQSSTATTLAELFAHYRPVYLTSWEAVLRELVTAERWQLVHDVLEHLATSYDKLNTGLCAEAVRWALQSGALDNNQIWLSPLKKPQYGIKAGDLSGTSRDDQLAPYLAIAFGLGWTRVDLDARDIASEVYQRYDPKNWHKDARPATLAILRASAVLGRGEGALREGSIQDARTLISPILITELLGSLWSDFVRNNLRYSHFAPAMLAESITALAYRLGDDYEQAALAQAMTYAAQFPVDQRMKGLWSVLARHEKRELQRKWLTHWLGPEGEVWRLSRDETHSIAIKLLSLAHEIGECGLADSASARLKWLLIGYRGHKEYGLSQVHDWFEHATRVSPSLWRTVGWKLWTICDACDKQGGDNRIDTEIRISISAAALSCGAADWWTLIQATIAHGLGGYWHNQTRQLLVDGVTSALAQGGTFHNAEIPILWGLSVALSYWHDEGDNHSLRTQRDALLQVPATPSERQPFLDLLVSTTRSASLDRPRADDTGQKPRDPDEHSAMPLSAVQVLERMRNGTPILPSVAASAVRELSLAPTQESKGQVAEVLGAIGDSISTNWDYADRDVLGSLDSIVRTVPDQQLWHIVAAIARGMNRSESYHDCGVYPNLLKLALARAEIHGLTELTRGLEVQLSMHRRWASSGDDSAGENCPTLPTPWAPWEGVTWRTVATRLLGVLFSSSSAEVITAAIEGAHTLVAADPSLVPELFKELSSEWPRYWLLHAAEVWAVLHPEQISAVRPILQQLLIEGSLVERLQSWIVLCRHADVTQDSRPDFSFPAPALRERPVMVDPVGLLHSRGSPFGHIRLSDRHSATRSMLFALNECGWDLGLLASEMASALASCESEPLESQQHRPNRRGDIYCHDLAVETAVGRVILSVLAPGVCDISGIVKLAQAYLDNDEPWLQRCPPRRALNEALWPSRGSSGERDSLEREMSQTLCNIALTLDMPSGWRTFAARVLFCTSDKDFLLDLWYEKRDIQNLFSFGGHPSCPSGRTFLWWLGSFVEPPIPNDPGFVSGYFVGGRQRLHHDHIQIQPPKAWRDHFGWAPVPTDPLAWRSNGDVVARYERLHGPLHDEPNSPNHRQPLVDRWIIRDEAFAAVEGEVGSLRVRTDYNVASFRNEDE